MANLNNIIIEILKTLKNVNGDFAEFGVYQGFTFIRLLSIAKQQNKKIHGFDSFIGMPEPTKEDIDPKERLKYPKGKFDVEGSSSLIKKLTKLGYEQNKDYVLWEGYIPQIFEDIPKNIKFSFCYVDLDQYKSTLATLEWIWERLSIDGIIVCDDYFSGRDILAAKAIDEFLKKHNNIKIIEKKNWITYSKFRKPSQILFKKV